MKKSVLVALGWPALALVFVLLLSRLGGPPVVTAAGSPAVEAGGGSMALSESPAALLVKFRTRLPDSTTSGGAARTGTGAVEDLLAQAGVAGLRPLLPHPPEGPDPSGLARLYRVTLQSGRDAGDALTLLAASPLVEYAEPDYPAEKLAVPNDPRINEQWAVTTLQLPAAWDVVTGTPAVAIAVLDSGLDLSHPDLAPNLWVNPGEVAGNGLDDDGNSFIDDVNGWNFIAGSNNPADDNGHGTLVAGIAAARINDGIGIAGVCGGCRILPVKVMQPSGFANYSDIAAGITYAAGKGARVINLAVGGYADSQALRDAIAFATSRNAVLVAGVGNDNKSDPFYPAAYPEVLAVAGTTASDTKTVFSNYGPWVDLAAPGEDILTTALGGDYVRSSGTSLDVAFAAGLAGLIVSQNLEWTPAAVRAQLLNTADPIDSLNPTHAGQLGRGRLNAARAVQPPQPILALAGYTVNGAPNGRPDFGATAALAVTIRNDWADAANVQGTLATTDPHVTIDSGAATFGTLASGETATNVASPFQMTIASSAGYNHPIPLSLTLTTSGTYSVTLPFTVTTRSSVEPVAGTIAADTTWTSDKTYLVNGNVGIAPGATLTIQPGTVVQFNGDYALNVGGTLIADGTAGQPIVFQPAAGVSGWQRILFDDPATDAATDGSGAYQSGTILRHIRVEGASSGLVCTTATPYLANVTVSNGGLNCSLGIGSLWLSNSSISGNVTVTGSGQVVNSTVSGGALSITGAGQVLSSTVGGNISLGDGSAVRASSAAGGLTIGGDGSIENSSARGTVSLSSGSIVSATVQSGSVSLGSGSVLSSTIRNGGLTVGAGSTVQRNNIENAPGTAIQTSGNVTVTANRVVGSTGAGIVATSGTLQGNLIANGKADGAKIGAVTVISNTFIGNAGRALYTYAGIPVTIAGNNFEFNTGAYDLYNDNVGTVSPYVIAQDNWWGTTDTAAISARIFDFDDDYNKGRVSFTPVLSGPSQDSPAYVRNVTLNPPSPVGIQTVAFDVDFSRPYESPPQVSLGFAPQSVWTTRASMPTARKDLAAVTAENGLIYVFGGCKETCDGPNDFVGTVEEYNPDTDAWRTRAPMPTARRGLAVASAPNGKIYAVGGYTGQLETVNTVEEYDPASDTWQSRASMPTARAFLGLAASPNGKLYAIGGWSGGSTYLATVEEYDPISDTWTTKTSMPTPRRHLGVVAADDGALYAIGGDVNSPVATVERYDPATDSWSTRKSMPSQRTGVAAVKILDGRLYVLGGGPIFQPALATVEEYDPQTDTWSTRLNMPTARTGLAAATTKTGHIYAIGGAVWVESQPRIMPGLSVVEEMSTATQMIDKKQWIDASHLHAEYDFTSFIRRGAYHVSLFEQDGERARVVPGRQVTFTVDYAGAISDSTPPPAPTVTASGEGSLTTIGASWSVTGAQSAITLYRYAIGTAPGATDVVNWTTLSDTTVNRTDLNLLRGQSYYVSVQARNSGGLWSAAGVSKPIVAGVVPTPSSYLAFLPLAGRGSAGGW